MAGVFGSFDLANNGGAQFAVGVSGIPGAVVSTELASVDKSWTAGGRLGYLVAPDTLVYMLAGYTTTSFNPVSYNIFSQVTGTASLPDFHGVTVGGGFEKLIFDNFSARAEYRNTQPRDPVRLSGAGARQHQRAAHGQYGPIPAGLSAADEMSGIACVGIGE